MAYDKLVDSTVLDNSLKAIADAIREKAGTSDALAFPAGMAEAIAAIEAGGGDVKFATGTVVLAEEATSFDINHNLGVYPSLVFVYFDTITVSPLGSQPHFWAYSYDAERSDMKYITVGYGSSGTANIGKDNTQGSPPSLATHGKWQFFKMIDKNAITIKRGFSSLSLSVGEPYRWVVVG